MATDDLLWLISSLESSLGLTGHKSSCMVYLLASLWPPAESHIQGDLCCFIALPIANKSPMDSFQELTTTPYTHTHFLCAPL